MAKLALVAFVLLGPELLVSGDITRYTNKWVVEAHGGEEAAQRVAKDLGYTYRGEVRGFENHYMLTKEDHPVGLEVKAEHFTRALKDAEGVKWAGQTEFVERTKRGYIPKMLPLAPEPVEPRNLQQQLLMGALKKTMGGGGKISMMMGILKTAGYSGDVAIKALGCLRSGRTLLNCGIHLPEKLYKHFMGTEQGDTAKLGKFSTKPMESSYLKKHKGVTKHVKMSSKKVSAYKDRFNDPLWPKQWYAQDYRTENMPVMDHNVVPVYNMGITGKDIIIAVVDDGVKHNHPDLQDNFLEDLSYNMCQDRPGSDPSEMGVFTNTHGTECAGEIAMKADNSLCGVGMAYNAKVAGVLTLCAQEDAEMESKSLVHQLDKIDIYTCSWGPLDDGKCMNSIPELTDKSLLRGIKEGRDQKGALYVFASGNGKAEGDNCAADYVVNHISTIPIASASQKGKTTFYSERCAAVFATAYSGGGLLDEENTSLDVKGACTKSFSGTSASVPLASSILALALEANKQLTYRDVMHLIVMTSEVAPLASNKNTWNKNGRGLWVSNDFGFGLLNGENIVTAAKNGWKPVPKKNICTVQIKEESPRHLTLHRPATFTIDTQACQDVKVDAVNFLEHVEVIPTIQFPVRGAISMEVTSPLGTKTTLLETRKNDHSKDGYNAWPILSVQTWGENPKGKWKIEVHAHDLPDVKGEQEGGYVNEITLKFHGTADKPNHYPKKGKLRKYSAFRLPNGKTSES